MMYFISSQYRGKKDLIVLVLISFLWIPIHFVVSSSEDLDYCPLAMKSGTCGGGAPFIQKRYMMYDVNPPEGFNLRRDVYMRMAIFARKLSTEWILVLPPWGQLYHWQSSDVGEQNRLPWSLFFDLESLQKFAPVIELHQFFDDYERPLIDELYFLQHYKDIWENKQWEEKLDVEPCHEPMPYSVLTDGTYEGWFWGYENMTAKSAQCLSFQGRASNLENLLSKTDARVIMFDRAEVPLHDFFGDSEYWKARRSMRFASPLVEEATKFREKFLGSSDEKDGTIRPEDWREEKLKTGTIGGPYIGVHLRRKDFLYGRPKQVPSVKHAAMQLKTKLEELKLSTVFLATDAPPADVEDFKQYLDDYDVVRYEPSSSIKQMFKDGGIAIIDQIICSHARYFIGTHESTFSFRIQEEREILGFSKDLTFNRLCGDKEPANCTQPTRWTIVF